MTASRVATCARARALQAVIDLVLEQFGGLVEQIDRHQPVGEPADHLVAAPPDRREIAEIVEQAERFDRRQRVAFAAEEQAVEGHRRLVLDRPGEVGIGMRQQRHPHDVEGVAIAVVLGVKMREQLEPFRFGLVAAPDRGERLERDDHVLARHVADGVAQQDLAQAALRGGAPVVRSRGGAVVGERVRVAAQGFFQAADQHGDRRLHLGRHADGLELVDDAVGAVEIAHLDGGSQRFAQRHALQFDRQRGNRAIDVLEGGVRLRPFALAGIGDRAPDRRVELVADHADWTMSLSASSGRSSMRLATALSTVPVTSSASFLSASATSSTALASADMSRAR